MNAVHIRSMLELQASMNAQVNPAWLTAGYPFLRANVVEGGEAMEHHGWKWWKKQTMDKAQFAIELIDIWHFTLSHMLVGYQGNFDATTAAIMDNATNDYQSTGVMFDGVHYTFGAMDTLARVELLIGLSVSRRISIPLFKTLMYDAGMSDGDLFRQYIGKNVLNRFRQDNGYKTGTYIKTWNGQEDNVVLAELMDIIPSSATYSTELYAELADRYRSVVE